MERAVSVREILRNCERRAGIAARLSFAPTRPGDQPLYIADTSKLQALTGWVPRRSVDDILDAIEMFWHEGLRPQPSHRSVSMHSEIPAREVA
jgi:UDP-glucose 4-epimerase